MKKNMIFAIALILTCACTLCACRTTLDLPGSTGKPSDDQLNISVSVTEPMETTLPAESETEEPVETKTEVTEPKETEPKATEPKATEPKETEPKATEPKATEPKETEPKATEPKATEPEITEPKETTPVHKHKYSSAVTKPATCTAEGVKTFTCDGCLDSYTEAIAKLGHSYTTKVTSPTCTAAGYTTHTCTRCANSYTDSNKAALGHNWKYWVSKFPNPAETGTQCRSCGNCGKLETATLAVIQPYGSYFINPRNNVPDAASRNNVSWKPYCVWWENGKLYAQCFVINDTNRDIRLEKLESIVLKNGDVMLGVLENVSLKNDVIEAKTYDIWQFEISNVSNYGYSLNSLFCSIETTWEFT